MFTSRITGTARALGCSVKPVRSAEALYSSAEQAWPRAILIDLGHHEVRIHNLMDHLRQLGSPMPRVVAYGSHVDAATLRAAREAGCDPVLPRSKFVEELPLALRQWLGT
jgi:CheY-like chemotaxis protein